jgi:hypothetical protein
MMVTTLREKPSGEPCEACAALRFDRAMAEAPGRINLPRLRHTRSPAVSPELDPPVPVTDPTDSRPERDATTVNPQPYFDRLAAAVERLNAARSLSRQLHALAEEAPTITNKQFALADRARALP